MKTKSEKYVFTAHSLYKIKHYGLSEQRVKRIIRHPARTEEAILSGMIAAMQPAGLATDPRFAVGFGEARALAKVGGKNYSEIWTIYQLVKRADTKYKLPNTKYSQIKVITAWRYPGKSPIHNPIPQDILNEIKSII